MSLIIALAAFPTGAYAATFKVIHSFCAKANCADGSTPMSDVFIDSLGAIYGSALTGGAHNGGVIYRLRQDAGGKWKYDTLYDFCAKTGCADGSAPMSRLIADAKGNLYGTTRAGANGGTAFKLMPQGANWNLKTIYRFCTKPGCRDGSQPSSGLSYPGADEGAVYDGISPLYGETQFGGSVGQGVVYSLTPNGGKTLWRSRTIHTFCSETEDCGLTDGSLPTGGLLVDDSGNLLGSTAGGGENFSGVIFRFSPHREDKWKEKIFYTFCPIGCADGQSPTGIIRDDLGNLFGTTVGMGGHGKGGTLFKFATDGTFTVLHDFCSDADCADGHQPGAPPRLDSSGNLYGTTAIGGGNDRDDGHLGGGVIYRLSTGGDLKVLHAFCAEQNCTDGATPFAGVTINSAGHLFGTTSDGGKFGSGVVYELTP
ncbi:MAG: hypothetical protein JO056_10575 [Alphaproteobacteria bacterium]|nr:hypothetical protein [Alphaproteobacteria bacterium]